MSDLNAGSIMDASFNSAYRMQTVEEFSGKQE